MNYLVLHEFPEITCNIQIQGICTLRDRKNADWKLFWHVAAKQQKNQYALYS